MAAPYINVTSQMYLRCELLYNGGVPQNGSMRFIIFHPSLHIITGAYYIFFC